MFGPSNSHGQALTKLEEHGPSQGVSGVDLSCPSGFVQSMDLLFDCAGAILSNDWELTHGHIRILLGS